MRAAQGGATLPPTSWAKQLTARLPSRAHYSQGSQAAQEQALLLLDGDMAAVDVWQLVNWPSRWERARREMHAGRVLVLPAFQLSPAGAARALESAEKSGGAPELSVMQEVIGIATAGARRSSCGTEHAVGPWPAAPAGSADNRRALSNRH